MQGPLRELPAYADRRHDRGIERFERGYAALDTAVVDVVDVSSLRIISVRKLIHVGVVTVLSSMLVQPLSASKTEDDLRAALKKSEDQVAAANKRADTAQAALAVAAKSKDGLSGAVTKLGADNQARSDRASAGTQSVVAVTQQASDLAQAGNNSLLSVARENSKTAYATLATTFIGFVGLIINAWRQRRAQEVTDATQQATATRQSAKLEQIHVLVNGGLTGAKEETLEAHKSSLVSLLELIDLKKAQGRPPSAEAMEMVDDKRKKIKDLAGEVADRIKQTEVADDELSRKQ